MHIGIRVVVSLVTIVCLHPSVASAAVRLNAERLEYARVSHDQVLFFDVFLQNIDTSSEALNGFSVAIDGPVNSPGGVRFLPVQPPSASHPYVFAGISGGPTDHHSTAMRIQASGDVFSGGVDITDAANGLFSVPVFIPANPGPGAYSFTFDVSSIEFADASGRFMPVVIGSHGILIIPPIPEPTAAAFLAIPGVALLRRRRARSAIDRTPSRR